MWVVKLAMTLKLLLMDAMISEGSFPGSLSRFVSFVRIVSVPLQLMGPPAKPCNCGALSQFKMPDEQVQNTKPTSNTDCCDGCLLCRTPTRNKTSGDKD